MVASLLLALFVIRPRHPDLWLQIVLDWLHVPLFGLIAIGLFAATTQRWQLWQRLLLSFSAAVLLSMATEAIQIPMATRNASAHDLGNDLLGAVAFLCLVSAFARGSPVSPNRRVYLVVASIVLIAWSAKPVAQVSAAYLERYRQAPSIAPLRSRSSRLFFHLGNATVRYLENPADDRVEPEFRLAREGSAGVDFHDPLPDWRSYDTLIVDISNTSDALLTLAIRVHDREHLRGDQPGSDRFRREFSLAPGRHRLNIELAAITRAPADRTMDLGRIDGLVIYRTGSGSGRRFILHDIRLE